MSLKTQRTFDFEEKDAAIKKRNFPFTPFFSCEPIYYVHSNRIYYLSCLSTAYGSTSSLHYLLWAYLDLRKEITKLPFLNSILVFAGAYSFSFTRFSFNGNSSFIRFDWSLPWNVFDAPSSWRFILTNTYISIVYQHCQYIHCIWDWKILPIFCVFCIQIFPN